MREKIKLGRTRGRRVRGETWKGKERRSTKKEIAKEMIDNG